MAGTAGAQGGPNRVMINAIEAEEGQFPVVSLVVAVNNLEGAAVTDLDASAFSAMEKLVAIQDLKVEAFPADMLIGIVIDSSKSYKDFEGNARRVDQAKRQAGVLVDPNNKRLQAGDRVGVFAFKGGQPITVLDFSADHNQVLDQGIGKVDIAGNEKTALFDIIRMSVDAIVAPQAYRRVLLIISDGFDKTSGIEIDKVIQQAQQARVTIYTVGLGNYRQLAPDQEDSKFLRRLALETGGQYIWYRPTQPDADKTMGAFLDAVVKQRQMYRLTYNSNECSGQPSVRVAVQTSGRQVEDSVTYKVPPFAPRVSLQGITNGQVLRDRQKVGLGIACASTAISKVEFLLDGKVAYTTDAPPFEFDWDTVRTAEQVGATPNVAKAVKVTARAYAGKYTVEAPAVTVGVVTLPPTPTVVAPTDPCPPTNLIAQLLCILGQGSKDARFFPLVSSLVALVVATAAVVLLVILIRRGTMGRAGFVVAEGVRRATRVFQRRTGIKGPEGVVRSASLACLVLESEPFRGKRIYIDEPNVLLGRMPEKSEIVFDWDDYVSGKHAKIQAVDGRFYLWDLDAANGTWVDDRRVPKSTSDGMDMSEAVELHHQSLIRLGPDLRIRFHVGSGPEASVAPPPAAHPAQQPYASGQGTPATPTETLVAPSRPAGAQPADQTLVAPSHLAAPGNRTERFDRPDQLTKLGE
jgi:VWFA-related protein